MATLQDLRRRRQSVQASQKLTSAMKMVASAKFTQFQKQWNKIREHKHFLFQSLSESAAFLDPFHFPSLAQKHPTAVSKTLILLIGADRGLCGGFNNQLIRFFEKHEKVLAAQGQEICVISCGNRMGDFLKKTNTTLLEAQPMGRRPHLEQASQFLEKACDLFVKRQIQKCLLIYTQFINAMRQQVIAYPLLPFQEPFQQKPSSSYEGPLLEPTPLILCEKLCRMTLESVVYQALTESCLSEQGARMTAMDNAMRNSEEVLKTLELFYNRQRQNLITNELLEVISGADL